MNNYTINMKILADNSIAQIHNVDELPVYINEADIYNYPNHQTIPHWNDGLETVYVCEGTMNIIVNGNTVQLKEGDVCVIKSGCVHYFESYNLTHCKFYCGVVEESLFTSSNDIMRKYLIPLFHASNPSYVIVPAGSFYNNKMRAVFRKIFELCNTKPAAYDLHIVAAFHVYIAVLFEALQDSLFLANQSDKKADEIMRPMLSFIHRNYAKNISTQDLCEAGHISRNQCFQLFNKYTGDTPANYILKYRLNMSRNFLKNTDLPIAQIATACGFAHQSHFTHHFSNQFGITPLKYRKMLQ